MAETLTGSTVPRRQLGRYLRSLRIEAGLTVRAAAKELERSEPTLWRMESGQVAVRALDVEQMCRLYGAKEDMTKALMALAKETKAKGWWQTYGDVVPEWFDLFVGLEAAANRMSEYEHSLIPGLFHTEAYARTLIKAEHRKKATKNCGGHERWITPTQTGARPATATARDSASRPRAERAPSRSATRPTATGERSRSRPTRGRPSPRR
jgi:transcriptional regulator with XRE-family HTH domain